MLGIKLGALQVVRGGSSTMEQPLLPPPSVCMILFDPQIENVPSRVPPDFHIRCGMLKYFQSVVALEMQPKSFVPPKSGVNKIGVVEEAGRTDGEGDHFRGDSIFL